MTNKEIIKEFYEIFGDERRGFDNNQPDSVVNLHKIETFWLSKLKAQKQEIEEIERAWKIVGSRPDIHERAKENLRKEWPILYYAILKAINKI